MSEFVITSFFVTPLPDIKQEFKSRYLQNGKVLWSKALCRNPKAFPFLKRYLKKWLPAHLKWISYHCSDLEFLIRYENRLDYTALSSNESDAAIELLERHIDRIDWAVLSSNKNAVKLLKKYPHLVDWSEASANTSLEMIQWISENLDKVDWFELSFNPAAERILLQNPDRVDSFAINFNTSAKEFLTRYPDIIDYNILSANPSAWAMEMVQQNLDQASFDNLSANEYAIDILLANPDRIIWEFARENPNVGKLYQTFPDKLDLQRTSMYESVLPFVTDTVSSVSLSMNPGLFCQDVSEYKERTKVIQRLISKFKK
jgi:hypothetical protein